MVQPALALGEFVLVGAQIGAAGLAEADIGVERLCMAPPQGLRLQHQRQFARIATLFADPAPVAG